MLSMVGLSEKFIKPVSRRLRKYLINYLLKRSNHAPGASKPVFSVIIPIYDRVSVVSQAIESVLAQSYRNFELLLICDGSPEDTRKIVAAFENHPQVRVLSFPENSGNACRGRNEGIRVARGKYVAFLDSDDLAAVNRLERTLFHFMTKQVDVVGGAIEYLVEMGSYRGFHNGQIGFTAEHCPYELLLKQNMLSICTVAVRRSCLMSYGGFRSEMRYREDHELWLRLTRNGCRIYNSPEILAKYRIHENNAETNYLDNDSHWFDLALELHKKGFNWN